MGLGETQRLTLLDDAHHDITAQSQWTMVNRKSDVDFSVIDGVPHIFSNKYGMAEVYASLGDNAAMARVHICKPEQIRTNTMGRGGAPMFLDSHRPLQIAAAAPHFCRIQSEPSKASYRLTWFQSA